MPTAAQLPASVASWTADPRRAVLLIHDMQRYFVHRFPAGEPPAAELVPNIAALRERCARIGVPVAYTAQPGDMTPEQRGLLRDFWGPGMRVDPADRKVVEPLEPAPGDWVLGKWRYSAFFRTDLLRLMRTHGRDQLLVCGVYAHIGVLATAVEAFTNDIQPFVVADAVADFSEQHHRQALDYAARSCAVVRTTAQVLFELDPAEAVRRIGARDQQGRFRRCSQT